MNEQNPTPQEVVLRYDSAEEVVLTYSQPTPLPDYPGRPHPEEDEAAWLACDRRRKRRRRGLLVFLLLLLAAVIVGAVSLSLRGSTPSSSPGDPFWGGSTDTETEKTCTIPRYEGADTAEMTLVTAPGRILTPQQLYQIVNPAVVTVMGYQEVKQTIGTGILFSENGFLLTNAHVIEGCSAAKVVLASGYVYDAAMVGYDYDEDLAVLKIEGAELPHAVFGDSDLLLVGDPAYAIGNPLGVDLRGTFTSGVISGLSREVTVGGVSLRLLQTDAALNSGNSGGPLIDQYGRVIGINTAKMQSKYANVEGLGLAIPTAEAVDKVNALIRFGEIPPTPTIGITVAPLTEKTADGHLGLEVWEVTPEGAGALAGIRAGDVVIRADGQELLENQDLLDARDTHAIGERMTLELCRGGEHLTVELTLQSSK